MVHRRALKLKNGDLVTNTLPDGGSSFASVEGLEAVSQALVIRFSTERGEDPIRPTLGYPARKLIGVVDEALYAVVAKHEALKDEDVRSVETTKVVLENKRTRRVSIAMDLLLNTEEQLNAVVF